MKQALMISAALILSSYHGDIDFLQVRERLVVGHEYPSPFSGEGLVIAREGFISSTITVPGEPMLFGFSGVFRDPIAFGPIPQGPAYSIQAGCWAEETLCDGEDLPNILFKSSGGGFSFGIHRSGRLMLRDEFTGDWAFLFLSNGRLRIEPMDERRIALR